MKFGNSDITIGQQMFAMRSLFPQFRYKREQQHPTWRGTLKPTSKSPLYKVKVIYPYPLSPKVWIVFPPVDPNAPHRYSDNSICLFFPKDRDWDTSKFVAKTIIPWTVEWLALYEIWCLTGEWYGDEAPHAGKK